MIESSIHWLTCLRESIQQRAKRVIASVAPKSDEQLGPWLCPGKWFWAAVVVGLVIRLYLVLFTEGTYDVGIWQMHIAGIQKLGLIGYYHANVDMNHPPFISIVLSLFWKICELSGISFRVFMRLPFALLDAVTAVLLLFSFRESRNRFVIMVCYWLNPLAIIFSAYHGNTDSSIAFFLILCFYLLSKDKSIWAGVVMGLSLWIKLPGILAIPAFLFFLPDWRRRMRFLLTVGIVGISTYLPTLLVDPAIVFKNILGYSSRITHTTGGIPVWGTRIFFPRFQCLSLQWQRRIHQPIQFYLDHNSLSCIVPIVFFSWLRRSKRTAKDLGFTIAGVYTILYGFSNFWSFQYFAWSLPFWFFARRRFLIPATLLATGYIYALYWFLCGNPWLLGIWNFVGHPFWPKFIELPRNFAVLFFFLSALGFLISGSYEEARRWWKKIHN